MTEDNRIFAPATARNREPILETLKPRLPETGTLLEIASGSGEHAFFMAPQLPHLYWQPSNLDAAQNDSVLAWRDLAGADNLLAPLVLDAAAPVWPVEAASYEHAPIRVIFNANMIHISPWAVCQGLMAGAGRLLDRGGMLFLYGPYKVGGTHTADSNIQFEHWLQAQDPRFGVRDIDAVAAEADRHRLELTESCPMPSNNFLQVFVKR
ncbi:DUF938 domain-containing protein [Sneathiella chinensis]|uniref:SAM-dependent methyltransferase n=1 Tax=Sneathiella chinensis TaxID=349750 RepID=A0ABQ5U1Z2_9PROT|nr:DUF938 domain-containing protein [Sneathiella chinensis]GLQ05367.1 SAM-dependent methyltransferase [Sneathiella chinensis]